MKTFSYQRLIKLIISLIITLTFSIVASSQQNTDVYRQVIKDLVIKNLLKSHNSPDSITLVILDEPSHVIDFDDSEYPRFKEEYSKLNLETFKDFIANYQRDSRFDTIQIPGIEIILYNKDSILRYEDLYLRYPNWNLSITELSNIGFNDNKNQALVYFGAYLRSRSGVGVYLVYECKNGKWKLKKKIPAWQS